ncbi:kinase-like domain-containing protein [Suillus subaureus]|uniref:Kinase-like domain-containing protein n=1 Tax=Suillus subaureus TaxID=48587 RepID=A0A9P7EE38_9AGAM|nr:kinase-like domain-containing protein [Suillus subaureus]KAG1818692.1 kinase-like domain-containing protein [Suillus subaureus]
MTMEASATEANDVFSLSDHLLAERLQFVKEIGFGNWGSVWLCRPKSSSSSNKHKDVEVAVKLVHRSKTSTTAARVRSLWNEMKIVRSFKADPHPSIIPFHSFIITPSYALITMAYLPTLVPVEVSEPRAKEWFRSLLSGVHFLHERGVVHNDIKPANILLSHKNIPVLVDFGFAEKYDLSSPKAFHSNLAYGTPEYLSPERARGLPHDTRKSDIWSLGVTFFEILVGRTPFEYEEGEQFASKADLEKYWGRTMRGKWVGSYTVPRPVEKLLKRMIVPNADLRCTAKQAMADTYWQAAATTAVPDKHVHKKSASAAVSPAKQTPIHTLSSSFISPPSKDTSTPKDAVPKDAPVSRLLDISLPWSSNSRSSSRSSASRSVSRTPEKEIQNDTRAGDRYHARSKSQPKLRSPYPHADGYRQGRKLSTVQGSPVVKSAKKLGPAPLSLVGTTNMSGNTSSSSGLFSLNSLTPVRKPLGSRTPSNLSLRDLEGGRKKGARIGRENMPRAKENSPLADSKENTPQNKGNGTPKMSGRKPRSRSRAGVFADLTGFAKNVDLGAHGLPKARAKGTLKSVSDLRNVSRTDLRSASRPDFRDASKTDVQSVSRTDISVVQNTSRASLNEHRTPNASTTDLANVSTTVNVSGMADTTSSTVGKGSVRDRMREWERERERLREMERLTEMQREAESIMTSANGNINDDDETELSDEEVECAIQREEAQEARRSPVPNGQTGPVDVYVQHDAKTEETDSEIDPNVTSYRADLSAEHIEIARIGVRASAQLLTMSKGSVSVLGVDRSYSASTAPAECNLPSEMHRVSESGFVGLKHSVKASRQRRSDVQVLDAWPNHGWSYDTCVVCIPGAHRV